MLKVQQKKKKSNSKVSKRSEETFRHRGSADVKSACGKMLTLVSQEGNARWNQSKKALHTHQRS